MVSRPLIQKALVCGRVVSIATSEWLVPACSQETSRKEGSRDNGGGLAMYIDRATIACSGSPCYKEEERLVHFIMCVRC